MSESDFDSIKSAQIKLDVPRNGEFKKNHKVRITIHLDGEIISYFKSRAAEVAKGYQTLINDALRDYTGLGGQTNVIADLVRRVKRLEEEMLRRPSD